MNVSSMSRRRAFLPARLIAAVFLSGLSFVAAVSVAADSLPARLSDQEFWKLIMDLSEPGGIFLSDNLLSNEASLQHVIPDLVNSSKPGGVYIGVGPEQNFTYIAAIKPSMSFIVDLRNGNLDLHLMYKALFELSANRVEFVSRLFARKRPSGLTTTSTAEEIFAAFWNAEASEDLYLESLKAIQDTLTRKHGFGVSPDDLKGIQYVYHSFYRVGPRIQYSSSGNVAAGVFQPNYAELMTSTDARGRARGYLANEESFQFVKELQSKNLVVPLVGNFAGPKAIRAVGRYLKEKGATVSAFYLSNVEQYLKMDGIWRAFCANVATLPLDGGSTFIRSVPHFGDAHASGLTSELGEMMPEVKDCR